MLELRLLGPFRVAVNDEPVEEHRWARRKAKLLVKLLALSPHHQAHKEQVLELMWPESDGRAAISHFNNTVYAARRALEPELASRADSHFIITHEQQIMLCAPERLWIDVEEFERQAAEALKGTNPAAYEAALSLYGGELLVEDPYEDWVSLRRESLRLKQQDLLMKLVALWEAQGQPERAIERLRDLIESDPTHEEAHRKLMRLYTLTGHRQQALRQYRQCRDALQSELAAEPERETVELHRQILSHQLKPETLSTGAQIPSPAKHHPSHTEDERVGALLTNAAPAPPHNLPQELTSFVGRARELVGVKEALSAARLVTLTGPGGIGKTRLALRAAAELRDEYKDGVWLVELATLADASRLPQAVASVLGVQGEQNQSFLTTLSEFLRHKSLLLVLDNCEHLVEACAQLAGALLRASERLRILATSREALNIAGESVCQVPSLSVPDLDGGSTARTISDSEAVRLFTDRIHLSNPKFKVTERNASLVARLCYCLDGIPLAIELAAARARILSIEQMLSKLDDRFRLLAGHDRSASPQHQTLRATIDWSYNLLEADEKLLFTRLSVFAGGGVLEAIEAVCAGDLLNPGDIFDALARLVDKSLIFVEPRETEQTRYQILETIRQYGYEKLRESGKEADLRARHLEWFVKLATQAEEEMWKSGHGGWLARLERERENLRAALSWAIEARQVEAGLRIAGALWRFWEARDYQSEGREWFEKLLALEESRQASLAVRAKAYARAGALVRDQGDYERAIQLLEEGLSLYREVNDTWGIAATLNGLGDTAHQQGNYRDAATRYAESLALFQALGDERAESYLLHNLGNLAKEQGDYARATELHLQALSIFRKLKDRRATAFALSNLGEIAHYQHDYQRACTLHQQSLEIKREIGDKRSMTFTLIDLGHLARDEGDHERATDLYKESLLLSRKVGDKRGVAFCFEGLAAVACARGNHQRAARLFGAAEALREAIGTPLPSIKRADYEHQLAILRAAPDQETVEAAWTEGSVMPIEEVMALALEESAA